MKYFLPLLFIASVACNSASTEAEVKVIPNSVESAPIAKDPVTPTMVADLGISGMVCEMNCVNSVRTKLLSMAGVESMEIEFDPEAEVNHAFVKFDDKVVSKEVMIEAIEGLNENSYKVKSFEATPLSTGEVKIEESNAAASGKVKTSADYETTLNLPSLLNLFQGLL